MYVSKLRGTSPQYDLDNVERDIKHQIVIGSSQINSRVERKTMVTQTYF